MQLFLRVSQYYILRGNVPFPRAGHIYSFAEKYNYTNKKISVVKLKDLCKASRAAWGKWRDAGHPSHGPLTEEKKHAKKRVRRSSAEAHLECTLFVLRSLRTQDPPN